jgi:hypothetical protein
VVDLHLDLDQQEDLRQEVGVEDPEVVDFVVVVAAVVVAAAPVD